MKTKLLRKLRKRHGIYITMMSNNYHKSSENGEVIQEKYVVKWPSGWHPLFPNDNSTNVFYETLKEARKGRCNLILRAVEELREKTNKKFKRIE